MFSSPVSVVLAKSDNVQVPPAIPVDVKKSTGVRKDPINILVVGSVAVAVIPV